MKRLHLMLVVVGVWIWTPRAAAAQGSENPHGQLPRGLDCSNCHTANGWRALKNPLEFDHDKATDFPLTGRHAAVTCTQCHLGPRYDQVSVPATDCAGCHADVHQGRMQGTCASCHNTRAFREVAAVAVHARSGFPLTGSHLQAPCQACHQNDQGGAFAPLSTDCVSCHRDAYLNARMPDHQAAGFPTDCQQCHATLTWPGGVPFDHPAVARGFALVGAHALLRCQNCHVPPDGTLRFAASDQNDCIACHQARYIAEHGANGFPTTCLDCHNVNSWGDAVFDHASSFPLRGPHAVSCVTCHTTSGNYATFTCFQCHAHDRTRMDEKHKERAGYTYDSNACLRCHPGGRS